MKVHLTPELNKFPEYLRSDSGQNTVRHPEPMSPRSGRVRVEGSLLSASRLYWQSKDPSTPYGLIRPPHGPGIAHDWRTATQHRAIGGAP
jgi:hypothetical protein